MAKTKVLISFAVTAKLICVFVFAYADCWFSHEVAQKEYFNFNRSANYAFRWCSKCKFLQAHEHMSRVMRKPGFCLCENKGADQLRSNCEADQHLCFCYTDRTSHLLLKSEISSFLPASVTTERFMLVLVGNPEDRFSRDVAHISLCSY